jgi:hypothetical protein
MRYLFFLIFFCSLLSAHRSYAECDFIEAEYIDELSDITYIQHLEIDIKKHRHWAMNSLKVLSGKGPIEEALKKKFAAEIRVYYEFGQCTLSAKIRQNGDGKDHIKRWYGNTVSSLDVKLSSGNIGSITMFKLLLPETRNNSAEIFGTLLLEHLGFLSPRTRLLDVAVNGHSFSYLFQEKASKEMLEHNSRREGPILEGDEDMIWGYRDFEDKSLSNLSLGRLDNHKWASRGPSSFSASLKAFLMLQKEYLAVHMRGHNSPGVLYANPNGVLDTRIFPIYNFVLLSMNGSHALQGRNRKFYFDTMRGLFEPIYYDGNLDFRESAFRPYNKKLIMPALTLISLKQLDKYKGDLQDIKNSLSFRDRYALLSGVSLKEAEIQISRMVDSVTSRVESLAIEKNAAQSTNPEKVSQDNAKNIYLLNSAALDIDQDIYEINHSLEVGRYLLNCLGGQGCSNKLVTVGDIIDILATNKSGDQRTIIIHPGSSFKTDEPLIITDTPVGKIVHSPAGEVKILDESNRIVLKQHEPGDWFLIADTKIENWTIEMGGLDEKVINKIDGQRFNRFGITGCLTFLSVNFISNVSILSSGGDCEDSVNIIDSEGSIGNIEIRNAYADALDIDFSNLSIDHIITHSARNDCIDFSYTSNSRVENSEVRDCGDKGLSIGENSELDLVTVIAHSAAIGVSSKDYSKVRIEKFVASSVKTCLEAYKKKQEFGGAYIQIQDLECDGNISEGISSKITINGDDK